MEDLYRDITYVNTDYRSKSVLEGKQVREIMGITIIPADGSAAQAAYDGSTDTGALWCKSGMLWGEFSPLRTDIPLRADKMNRPHPQASTGSVRPAPKTTRSSRSSTRTAKRAVSARHCLREIVAAGANAGGIPETQETYREKFSFIALARPVRRRALIVASATRSICSAVAKSALAGDLRGMAGVVIVYGTGARNPSTLSRHAGVSMRLRRAPHARLADRVTNGDSIGSVYRFGEIPADCIIDPTRCCGPRR
jgi:hypothetical protein